MNRGSHEIERIRGMVDDCLNVIEIPRRNGGPGYDDRAKEFIRDLADKLEEGSIWFSDKQIRWLGDLHNRI